MDIFRKIVKFRLMCTTKRKIEELLTLLLIV